MSKWYSISFQVFSSIYGVNVSIATAILSFNSSREATEVL
jgi:hypothetical protein